MRPLPRSHGKKGSTCRHTQDFAQLLTPSVPGALRAAAAILGDRHEAEDAVQEAAITAFRFIDQLRDKRAFRSWFLRIAVNKAIDLHRRRKREQNRAAALSVSLTHQQRTVSDDVETAMDVAEAVDQLPTTHRTVVRLYYAGGHTTPEIARLLDRPEGTVRRLLSEAYKMLRPLLAPMFSEGKG